MLDARATFSTVIYADGPCNRAELLLHIYEFWISLLLSIFFYILNPGPTIVTEKYFENTLCSINSV